MKLKPHLTSEFSSAGVPGKINAQSTLALVYKGVVTCMYGKHVEASYTEKLIEGIKTDAVSFGRNVKVRGRHSMALSNHTALASLSITGSTSCSNLKSSII